MLKQYTFRPTVVEVETRKALAKVRELLPAKVSEAVERYDRRTMRQNEIEHEPPPEPVERVRRARNLGLSQVWARRVRRGVVRIIEMRHLSPGPDNERQLQSFAARVWRILNQTRRKRGDRRQAMLEAATRSCVGEGKPSPEHLAAVRDGLLRFFREAEVAGALDSESQLGPAEDQPKYGFQPKPDVRPQVQAWENTRESLVEQLWQEIRQMPELAGLDPKRLLLWRSVVRQLCSAVDHQAPESDECKRQVEAMATDEHFSARGRDPALVRRLVEVVLPRWEELRASLGPHPLGRVRPPR